MNAAATHTLVRPTVSSWHKAAEVQATLVRTTKTTWVFEMTSGERVTIYRSCGRDAKDAKKSTWTLRGWLDMPVRPALQTCNTKDLDLRGSPWYT